MLIWSVFDNRENPTFHTQLLLNRLHYMKNLFEKVDKSVQFEKCAIEAVVQNTKEIM